MNHFEQQDGAPHATFPPYQRSDLQRRDIVNRGILVQENRNTMSALEYLKSHDIDPKVIERVLLEPQRRRQTA